MRLFYAQNFFFTMGGLGGAVERLAGSVGPVCQLRPVRPLMVGIVRRRLIFKYTLRIITMNAKFENSNSLLLNISPETKKPSNRKIISKYGIMLWRPNNI
jgi:hypothetical protein